jgi:signal transduction histidine kinase
MMSYADVIIRSCDLAIAIAYFTIPATILVFLSREKISLAFSNADKDRLFIRHVVLCVASFILVCGVTHAYRFTLLFNSTNIPTIIILFACALISCYTALLIVVNMQRLFGIMSKIEVCTKGTSMDLTKAFDLLLDTVPEMMSVHSLRTLAFLRTNNMCSVYGYDAAMLYTVPLPDIVHPEDRPIVDSMIMSAVSGQPYTAMFRIITADRVYVTVESTPKLGRWEHKEALFLLTRNIQHRVDVFDKKSRANNEQVRVEVNRTHAVNLAHDLRTGLAVLELCMREIKIRPSNRAIQSADHSLEFMKYIVDRTIDCCRVLQGERPSPCFTLIDAVSECRNAIELLSAYPKSVQITLDATAQSIEVLCDKDWLSSILVSLLCNACDNTMEGSIQLRVSADMHRVYFECTDTGTGIREHDMSRLFCPFSKLDNKLKPEHGIGIGLYNVAWRVRNLNGTYKFKHNAPRGSVFCISVPLQTITSSSDEEMSPLRSQRRTSLNLGDQFEHVRFMIVDDAPSFRMMLCTLLKLRHIHNIDEANDGQEALEKLKQEHYDIVLMDQHMPLMQGSDCIKAYKAWEMQTDRPETKFILMSADVIKNDSDILTAGFVVDFFPKPIKMARLMGVLQDIIQHAK